MKYDDDLRLLPTLQEQVGDTAIKVGFSPLEFKWSDFEFYISNEMGLGGSNYRCSSLVYLETKENYFFRFRRSGEYFMPEFSPGRGLQRISTYENNCGWNQVLKLFAFWLSRLREEISVHDYWSELAGSSISKGQAYYSQAKVSFSSSEIFTIKDILLRLEEKINSEATLADEHKKYIHESFESLQDHLTKMDKRAGMQFIIGMLFTVGQILMPFLKEEKIREIINSAIHQIAATISFGANQLLK